jgi:hypothetical protein
VTRPDAVPAAEPPPFSEWPDPQPRGVTSGWVVVWTLWLVAVALLERFTDTLTMVAGAGALMALLVAGGLARRWWTWRRVTARRRSAGALWEVDWTGSRGGATSRFLRRRMPLLPSAGTIALAVVWSFHTQHRFFPGAGRTCAFCVLGAILVLLAWLAFRGGPQVKFDRFPYLLGEPAVFWIATTSGASRLERAEVLLRCVHVPWREPPLVLFTRHAVLPREHPPGPDEFVAADLGALPREGAGTVIHAKEPVRWELLVAGRTRWGPLVETFVVPVYAPASVDGAVA